MFQPVSVTIEEAVCVQWGKGHKLFRSERVAISILHTQRFTSAQAVRLDSLKVVARPIREGTTSPSTDPRSCSKHESIEDVERVNCGICTRLSCTVGL